MEQDIYALIVFTEMGILFYKFQEFSFLLPGEGFPGYAVIVYDGCQFKCESFASEIFTRSILSLPNFSFFKRFIVVRYPASVVGRTPVFRETYFSTNSATVSPPPSGTILSKMPAATCFSFSRRDSPAFSLQVFWHSYPAARNTHIWAPRRYPNIYSGIFRLASEFPRFGISFPGCLFFFHSMQSAPFCLW